MHYRSFGATDLTVSEICYGPMRFSAKTPGDDPVSQAGRRASPARWSVVSTSSTPATNTTCAGRWNRCCATTPGGTT